MTDLLQLFGLSMFISFASFGGSAQALFYQVGVQQTHWISNTDLSAVLAFGFATPGPAVFGTAAFMGYRIGGLPGALVGTIGIYVVPFTLSVIAAKHFSHLLQHKYAKGFTTGIGLAAAGLVAATAFNLLESQHISVAIVTIAGAAYVASNKYKLNPLIILASGTAAGLLLGL
ncbi:MAG TPA: chromate transporter [Candidatus Saccharimonadales bacterium]|nr:chromate transporter [Candidatus Saccharimonadales bacterium]